MKQAKPKSMIIRSNQSAFSRAVIKRLEVSKPVVNMSWVEEVERRVCVDDSTRPHYEHAMVGQH